MNTNQFLQTARTVTFIIQKNKASIPSFDDWYSTNVLAPWLDDRVMGWAKDSRNTIEKEGDIDLHSSLILSLIFSYFQHEDINIACGRKELVGANVKRLTRFARRDLPSGVSDAAVVRIERRWVANSLPEWELLIALKYIYGRIHSVAASLGQHLGSPLDDNIPNVSRFDSLIVGSQRTSYVKLNDVRITSFKTEPMRPVANFTAPLSLVHWIETHKDGQLPSSLLENVQYYAGLAKLTFEHYGNHVPMLFMFDKQWRPIDYISAQLDDQATKFLFWRSMAERVLYIKPRSIIWISEAWQRSINRNNYLATPVRNMPIVGESLQVVGLDSTGTTKQFTWNVRRDGANSPPRLEEVTQEEESAFDMSNANFLFPIRESFEKLRQADYPQTPPMAR